MKEVKLALLCNMPNEEEKKTFLTSLTEAYVTRLMFTSNVYGQTEQSDTDTNSLEFPGIRETEHNYSRFYLRCDEVSLSRWRRNSP